MIKYCYEFNEIKSMITKKLNLLIVDDEPDILELVSEEFRYYGHNVITAKSGNEAVEILKNNTFDVVVDCLANY